MNLSSLFVCCVFLNVFGITYAVRFRDCGSSKADVISVTMSPCTTTPCVLIRGREASVAILFTASQSFSVGAGRVQAGSPSGFRTLSVRASDVCDHLTPACPVMAGRSYSFSYTGVVPKSTTTGQMTIRWELLDANLVSVVCAEFEVQIM
ncbi:hypothetical protein CRM22_003160 [Opisthorchis felineus]|uniref:MD-2-related lipid-recognition domain-containing protein n=1 Tax=Opisthorchis felineus TaxID=147828 RepID=A0A4S2M2N8_OPIFE|nr:hypothetical protein CRM22_003160 [Opisthorchis felineus]